MQQFEVVKVNTNFKVEEYYGAKGVDSWTMECWEKETNEHDVSFLLLKLNNICDDLVNEDISSCFCLRL